uniref:Ribosomal protein L6 n=1 Tax=Pleurocladia lacustris TaxID=246121 RepID=A0A1I9LW55_9PHAE|nr:ribosomal protein L6 [Pleurocladia lacustris]ANS57825.1 ribosomal protein L6 [Pleurocladia lacustris]ANS57867.1 ribosomal protein L6 [Pleurocladia lacustris]
MTVPVFRIPIGVECSSNKGKVCVSGLKGTVSFNSVSNLYRKGNLVIFLPYLTPYYSSIFKQAIQGVVFGYSLELSLKGIGYRVREEKRKLFFSLGYSKPVILDIPKDISIKFNKKSFLLNSANFGVLQNFATTIRRYRFPDSYKGAGVLYAEEKIVCKEGKKT